jgi:hypothetical protein
LSTVSLPRIALIAMMMSLSACSNPVSGLYSASHKITSDGKDVMTKDVINIDENGHISAYAYKMNDIATSTDRGCYSRASGTDANAILQNQILTQGISPNGKPDYQVRVDDILFGIITAKESDGKLYWFVRTESKNNIAYISGNRNVYISGKNMITITLPPMTTLTMDDVIRSLCKN